MRQWLLVLCFSAPICFALSEGPHRSFDQIMEWAAAGSPTLKRIQAERERAIANAEVPGAIFFPKLFSTIGYDKRNPPVSNPFSPSSSEVKSAVVGYAQSFPLGLGVQVRHGIEEKNLSFATSSDVSNTGAFLELETKWDLLRNLLGKRDRSLRAEVKLRKVVEKYRAIAETENFLLSVGQSFFSIVSQQEANRNQKLRCKTLGRLERLVAKRYGQKLIERKSLLQAKGRLLNCKNRLKVMELTLRQNRNNLKQLLGGQALLSDTLDWPKNLSNESWKGEAGKDPNLVLNRSALLVAKRSIEISEKELRKNTLDNRPDLFLTTRIKWEGQDDNLGSAYSDIGGRDFPSYFVGLTLELPLGQTPNKERYRSAVSQLQRQQAGFELLRLELTRELMNVWETIQTYELLLEDSLKLVLLETERLQRMERDFEGGRVDLRSLIEVQSDLTDAQEKEVDVKVKFLTAELEYLFLTGKLYEWFYKKSESS